jgi:hypothetical protein
MRGNHALVFGEVWKSRLVVQRKGRIMITYWSVPYRFSKPSLVGLFQDANILETFSRADITFVAAFQN